MPTLRIKLPNHGEVTHVIAGDMVTIGRLPDNAIQINDASVSGYHAELVAIEGDYWLHDLRSTNLSFVNGTPVSDFHLDAACRLAFGTVECQFDPDDFKADAPAFRVPEMERDIAFLRADNSELQGKINELQRRVDILNSARLVTGRTETTPNAVASDSLRAVVGERDDLRHQNAGLKLEFENLREELSLTAKERDSARQTAELLQMEKVALLREINLLRSRMETHAPLLST